ncbi:unnamed protein product [Eruca vesicaria subsp. sativa]|uniref:F-box associated beta-propeller type 3 domain-containing protein n=1 Tax=Eruca vesicaria subsp. sativa TaxID=29727 RepID=A0ABC8LI94_ERUVS|nr:unnamed protein product [Eruca vesicaria subsp. sativa]
MFCVYQISKGLDYIFSRKCFLGYDEATRVFKVLWPTRYDKPLVYTVISGGQGSWRQIACKPPHIVFLSCAMCEGGVLYYAAISLYGLKSIVMCFNVNSEKFKYRPLPEGVSLHDDATMVNYNGKVALVNKKSKTGVFQICVRNEVSGEWELHQLVIPGWRANVGNDHMMFSFVGTIGTGELVFTAPDSLHDGSESVLHYNTDQPEEGKKFKMFSVGAVNGGTDLRLYNPIANTILQLPVTLGGLPDECLFGYDEANGVFKVLGFFGSRFEVYTAAISGTGEGSWR